jgi:hypothetical protein
MSKVRRSSEMLDKASSRLEGMKSIQAALDLGNGLSVAVFESSITETRTRLNTYHHYQSLLDEARVELNDAEKSLADISERVLAGIASKFGKDSAEYVQAGGVRKSSIKRSARRAPTTINSPKL